MSAHTQRGLTLAELLVALLVFSFVAAASVYSLRLGVEAREQLTNADNRLSELELGRALIKEDMMQLMARPVRDEFGNALGPPLHGGIELRVRPAVEGERLLLSFVRNGWANPENRAPRSLLQYVEYVERNGSLIRRARPYLDDARGQPHFERVLFHHAEKIRIAFLSGEARGELQWAEGWPLPGSGTPFPKALSLSFSTERYGELTQLFWIGEMGQP